MSGSHQGGRGLDCKSHPVAGFQKIEPSVLLSVSLNYSKYKDALLIVMISPFNTRLVLLMNVCKCKKTDRNLVRHIHGREISVLQKKSSWGNQVSVIPFSIYSRFLVYMKQEKKKRKPLQPGYLSSCKCTERA